MRSVTSSFNRTLYHKNMTRFWPIWVLYTLIFAFALPMQVLIQKDSVHNPQANRIRSFLWEVCEGIGASTIASAVFGVLIAMAVFSYLYQSRSACMMHALPVSRKSLYFTNYLSGLSMMLIPNLVIAVLTFSSAVCRNVWEPLPILVWFFAQSSSCIFFFSFASFCAMFTGNLFALPVFYGVLNFLVWGVGMLMYPILSSLLYGFTNYGVRVTEIAMWFTPYARMAEDGVGREISTFNEITRKWVTEGYEVQNLHVFAIYLVAGLVIALLGYLVYTRYETERAGDVVAEVRVHPLFRYGLGFCGGLVLGLVTTFLIGFNENDTLVLISLSVLWGIISYFVAEMLLQKSFKVIKKAWKGALVFAALMSLVFVAITMDFMGYSRFIPQMEDVQAVYVRVGAMYNDYDEDVTDPQIIQQIMDVHEAIANTGKPEWEGDTETQTSTSISIRYVLNNGEMIYRDFDVSYLKDDLNVEGTVTHTVDTLFQNQDFVKACNGLTQVKEGQVQFMQVREFWDEEELDLNYRTITLPEEREAIFDAIARDYEEGNWGQVYLFDDASYQAYDESRYMTTLEIEYEYFEKVANNSSKPIKRNDYMYVNLTPDCVHTIGVLHQLGILDDSRYLVNCDELETLYNQKEMMDKKLDRALTA